MSNYELISENEALKKRVNELEGQLETAERIVLGDLNKIKAEAVREAKLFLLNNGFNYGAPYKLDEFIDQLEQNND